MPNTIKYSTGSDTLALKKGNFYIGTGDVGKGPTESTGYWNGITPPVSGYTIYLNKETQGPSAYVAPTDNDLITITNQISGQNYTGVTQCLTYFASQTDRMVLNIDYPSIVTNGLVLNLDAGFVPSYPRSGTTWSDISLSGNSGTLTNGPTYSSDGGGSISFDGTNDYARTANNINISLNNSRTIDTWFRLNNSTARHVLCSWGVFSDNLLCNLEVNQAVGTNYPYFVGFNNDAYVAETILINTWTNIILTYDGGAVNSASGIKFYINGILKTNAFANNLSLNTTNSQVFIGYEGAGARNPMNGQISITKIYNRALTATEILQNYNATKSRFGL